jgi:hypothetical protein
MTDTDTVNDADALPVDDRTLVEQETATLNRLDEQWGCTRIVAMDRDNGPEHCGIPEHDPYSGICYAHSDYTQWP